MTAVETHRQHGTHVKFVVDKCRCDPCRLANNTYERERRARLAPPYVSAEPARRHVQRLARQGVGLKTIAKVSGVSHGTLSKLIYGDRTRGRGPSKRVRPETSSKILGVMPSDAADGAKVDAGPSWVILDGLIAAGVPKSQLAERLGQTTAGLQLSRGVIAARNARAVADLGREWRAGEFTYERRSKHGVETVTLPAPEVEPAPDEHDRVILKLVTTLEARIDQADWRVQAACRGRATWMWFPARGDVETLAAAKRICDSCFVREQCLEANLDQNDGVFGGMSGRERRRYRAVPA